jgi:branched-chain amino acid transport system ATP-binding protein
LSIAHRAYVLASGRIVLTGLAGDLLSDPAVQEAYLGKALRLGPGDNRGRPSEYTI